MADSDARLELDDRTGRGADPRAAGQLEIGRGSRADRQRANSRVGAFALRAPGTSGEVRVGGLHLELPMASGDANVEGKRATVPSAAAPAAAPAAAVAESTLPQMQPNLIIYLIDTLRADHLGCYGYRATDLAAHRPLRRRVDPVRKRPRPELMDEASGGHGADRALPGGARGRAALAADPRKRRDARRKAASGRLNETALFTTNANIVARFGFDQGWDSFQYLTHRKGRKHEHLDAAEMNAEIFAWLAARERRRPTKPLFLFVHTLDPHDPYRPREEYRSRFAPGVDVETECCLRTPQLAALPDLAARNHARAAMALHDAEIAQNDAAFGDFLDELERRGLARTSAVLFTADHGEEFLDHGGWKHGFTLYEEMLRFRPAPAGGRLRGGGARSNGCYSRRPGRHRADVPRPRWRGDLSRPAGPRRAAARRLGTGVGG